MIEVVKDIIFDALIIIFILNMVRNTACNFHEMYQVEVKLLSTFQLEF